MQIIQRATIITLVVLAAVRIEALDPPHDAANSIQCVSCHLLHRAPGGTITRVAGNPNLCITCHSAGGQASAKPFASSDKAKPGVSGTSHRWDSGPSGWVEADAANASTGTIRSGGTYSGRVEQTYTMTIAVAGDAGSATFNWTSTGGGIGTGVVTGAAVPLADGLTLSFLNGGASPSFRAGDRWRLYVRTDLRLPSASDPFERPMWQRLAELTRLSNGTWDSTFGKVVCSVCHNQHLQDKTPFDPNAPAYAGAGSGAGRHFQRQHNDANQMCHVCHAARNVQASSGGSHPVGVTIPAGAFQSPSSLPLTAASKVECLSCHAQHYATSGGANGGLGDGYLLRLSMGSTCYECHTLADSANGSHFSPVGGALWPGGQYGSSFPAHSSEKRGWCVNCHWPHGWPDDANPATDYTKLWVERYDTANDKSDRDDAEDLCYTCHDGTPSQTNIRADLLKGTNGTQIYHHPVMDSQQSAGRSVECRDCHNPHKARANNRVAGATGVDLVGTAVGPGTANDREITQYELCFKCHGDNYNATRTRTSNKRLDFNTSASNSGYHPVTQAGRGQSANLAAGLRGGLTTSSTLRCTDCHNSDATSGTAGPVTDSTTLTQGPHGSLYPTILRNNFSAAYTVEGNFTDSDAALCLNCHDATALLSRRRSDGARSNFYNTDRDNLHNLHLRDKQVTDSCLSCHYDQHSNRTASNTEYRWFVGGVWTASNAPPPNVRSHLINFAPDVTGNSFARPRWQIDTTNGTRTCNLTCHGESHNLTYEPPAGDETSHTF